VQLHTVRRSLSNCACATLVKEIERRKRGPERMILVISIGAVFGVIKCYFCDLRSGGVARSHIQAVGRLIGGEKLGFSGYGKIRSLRINRIRLGSGDCRSIVNFTMFCTCVSLQTGSSDFG